MHIQTWQPVRVTPAPGLGAARHQAHNAALWLARIAHSFAPHDPAGAHLALRWDPAHAALVTSDVGGGLSLGLDIAALALQFREYDRRSPHVLAVDGRTPAEVEAWILVELLHRLRDRDRFSKALPFAIPAAMSGDGVHFAQQDNADDLAELSRWFQNAASALCRACGIAPALLCCDPHHFDLHVVLSPDGATPPAADVRHARAIRLGFMPGDDKSPEPCFYAVARRDLEPPQGTQATARIGTPRAIDHADLVLPASKLADRPDAAAAVGAFLSDAIAKCRKRIAH